MASSRNQKLCLCFTATLIILFSLTALLPHPQSAGIDESSREQAQLKKMMLGSRPPACMNKCLNCRPCEATLVIPPHNKDITTHDHDDKRVVNINNVNNNNGKFHDQLSHREDGSYYLLSWKCRCGNKIYQP